MYKSMAQFNFKAIGTSWQIDVYEDNGVQLDLKEQNEILVKIRNRIDAFDEAYSRFRSDSIIAQISKNAGQYEFPADSVKLFETYFDLYKLTNGYFTPLVGQILVDAGYDADYSLKQKRELTIPPKWEDVMEFKADKSSLSKNILKIKKPVQLDFGAAGKGYIIDLVGKVLEENGYKDYCIDAGGDILHKRKGNEERSKESEILRVGLEDPENADQVIGVYNLGNASICGSAGNRRRWGDFTHIMNPKTLASPTDIIAVWVIADSALLADALTTCLFFVKPESLMQKSSSDNLYKFEYFILYKDRSFEKSANFNGEVFM